MISSGSSSGRRAALGIALLALSACRHAAVEAVPRVRLAVFPVQNASGGAAPIRALTELIDAQLAERGVDIVPRKELDEVLARHRIRPGGGIDRRTAKVLREELSVDGALIPTLEEYDAGNPPKVALAVRIVDVGETPVVLWADDVARSGEDAPGLLRIGVIARVSDLEREVVLTAARAVERWVANRSRGETCGSDSRFTPRRQFRAPVLDDVGRRTIAVLPFANETRRRSADEVVLGQLVADLVRSRSFEVLDPGVVREELLANRIVFEGGVSLDRASTMLDLLNADLVASGEVHDFAQGNGATQPPAVSFSAYVIDRLTGEVVWSSTSRGEGNDRVFFFGAGRVYSTTALSCRMTRGVIDAIVGDRGELARVAAYAPAPQRLRVRASDAQLQRRARDATPQNPGTSPHLERARDMYLRDPPSKPEHLEELRR